MIFAPLPAIIVPPEAYNSYLTQSGALSLISLAITNIAIAEALVPPMRMPVVWPNIDPIFEI